MMQVIEWHQFLEKGLPLHGKQSAMTVGIFDGIHRGHQALINSIIEYGSKADLVPVVVTFKQNYKGGDIQTFPQKLEMLEKLGIKMTIVIDFSDDFRQMPGVEFLELLLKHGNVGFFAAGSNFQCGRQLDTNSAEIQRFFAVFGIPVSIVPEVTEGSLPISSSRIRAALAAGEHPLAQAMLGYDKK